MWVNPADGRFHRLSVYAAQHPELFSWLRPIPRSMRSSRRDLSDNGSPKYVFRGWAVLPYSRKSSRMTITGKRISLFESDVHIFVYNIDKFNKEGANMKKVNELIGDSFYQALSDLPDLVLIMDESHHYRAERECRRSMNCIRCWDWS